MRLEPGRPRIAITDLAHPFFARGTPWTTFGVGYSLSPLFHVTDDSARTLGVYQDTGLAALAVKTVGQACSVFCGANKLTTALLRGIAREAGVHLYSDSEDPFEANDQFILLHTSTAGTKTLTLKAPADVVDVYTGEVLFRRVPGFTMDLPAEQTRFWFVGNAADFPSPRPALP
jgi:hypothetical protein